MSHSPATTSTTQGTTVNGSNSYYDQSLNNLLPSSYPIATDNYSFGFNASSIPPSSVRPDTSSERSDRIVSASPMQTSQPVRFASPGNPHQPASASSTTTWGIVSHSSSTSSPSPGQIERTYPPLNYFVTRRHSLDRLPVSRERIMDILGLFFSYVYPLTPCVHKPSFMADIEAHREETDPMFFALILSTVASTLVQVPRSYLPFFDRPTVRKLALYCSEASRLITVAGYDNPGSTQVVIRYL